jgi:hypothetical protein
MSMPPNIGVERHAALLFECEWGSLARGTCDVEGGSSVSAPTTGSPARAARGADPTGPGEVPVQPAAETHWPLEA